MSRSRHWAGLARLLAYTKPTTRNAGVPPTLARATGYIPNVLFTSADGWALNILGSDLSSRSRVDGDNRTERDRNPTRDMPVFQQIGWGPPRLRVGGERFSRLRFSGKVP